MAGLAEPIRENVEHTGGRLRGARFFCTNVLSWRGWFAALLPGLWIFFAHCSAPNPVARDVALAPISLQGPWEYRILAAPGSSSVSPTGTVRVPFDWSDDARFVDFSGCVQLKRRLPQAALDHARRSAIALGAGHTSDVARFYLNDPQSGLIGSIGADPNLTGTEYRTGHDGRLLKTIPVGALRSGDNWLIAEICTRPGKPFFWRGPRIAVGPAEVLFDDFMREVAIDFSLAALYISISLYHLLLAIRRPREIFNLYFGLFAMAFASFHLANTSAAELIYGQAKELQSIVDQVSLMIFSGNLLLFLSRFFLGRHSRLAVAWAAVYFCFAVIDIFVNHTIRLILLDTLIYSMVLALPYILILTAREAWRGSLDARLLLVGVALIVVGAIHDISVESRVIQSVLIMPFAFLAFILGIAVILANRFVRLHSEVEELNASLENKVRKRTADLQSTLQEVRKLKDQQDGDYFLTAQLLQPLAGNHTLSDHSPVRGVQADYLSRQKKTFRFRHWESEIGGDLCALHSLRLRGRDVLVFFNGDAMGKSMQGAGGALIMGTVFKTIITRTQQMAKMQELYPEHWLRQCYQELKSVMIAFDGRMLVSMVVGIVDDATGMLYFVNAEHPHVVLLREGQAQFVEERGILRKVGMDDPQEIFVVQTLPLQPNDVVVVGSDGRDDVEVGRTEEGVPMINEDELAFLTDVEKSEGRLDRLEELIRERGTVIDDLSLIRIAYREDAARLSEPSPPDYLQLIRDARTAYRQRKYEQVRALIADARLDERDAIRNREALRMLLRAYIETEDFAAAADLAASYTEQYAEDNTALLWYSFVLRRVNEPARAIDAGERLFMRDPGNSRNLRHLAGLHAKHGDQSRGAELLKLLLELKDPDNADNPI